VTLQPVLVLVGVESCKSPAKLGDQIPASERWLPPEELSRARNPIRKGQKGLEKAE
jgi:hypothetical protein